MKPNTQLWQHLAQFFIDWEMLRTKTEVKINKPFTFDNFFFPKIVPFARKREKYCTARQATLDNTIQRIGYRHVMSICNTHSCHTSTAVPCCMRLYFISFLCLCLAFSHGIHSATCFGLTKPPSRIIRQSLVDYVNTDIRYCQICRL